MHPAVRVGLVVLGAAMAVYGAASLTGGWLGTPLWSDPTDPEAHGGLARLRLDPWHDYGRERWIGGVVSGLGLVALAAGVARDRPDVPRHHRRFVLVACGVAVALLGAAPLARGWLGSPPWWQRIETQEEEDAVRRELMYSGRLRDQHELLYIRQRVPREGRERISGGVVAAGLALVAVGAWPRRRGARRRRTPSWTNCRWPDRRESA
ncbi:MAG: hypothetical protein JNM10_09815 [Planctomycetia bacterium]|nr:hypothetical protein [Planctomycetia bacterium]